MVINTSELFDRTGTKFIETFCYRYVWWVNKWLRFYNTPNMEPQSGLKGSLDLMESKSLKICWMDANGGTSLI